MPATVHHLPIRPRTTLRDLCEPDRAADLKIIRVLDQYQDEGRVTYAADGTALVEVGDGATREDALCVGPTGSAATADALRTSPTPFVSPRLAEMALSTRSESEARAAREPRVARGQGLLNPLFGAILSPFRPVS